MSEQIPESIYFFRYYSLYITKHYVARKQNYIWKQTKIIVVENNFLAQKPMKKNKTNKNQ